MVRLRSVLRRVDGWLGGLEEEDSEEGEEAEGEDLLDTPGSGSEEDMVRDTGTGFERRDLSTGTHTDTHTHISTPTPTPIPTSSAPGPGPGPEPTPAPTTTELEPPTSTLRNRHHPPAPPPPPPAQPDHQPHHAQKSEQTLSTHRQEQEDLTTSLLSLATQLKTSTKTFQSQLESEKSILARAVDGLDRTASNMEAAERRMGLLRRMTEGKGWWGRMMLYAWIFAGWVVAILIVFVGPKVRF